MQGRRRFCSVAGNKLGQGDDYRTDEDGDEKDADKSAECRLFRPTHKEPVVLVTIIVGGEVGSARALRNVEVRLWL